MKKVERTGFVRVATQHHVAQLVGNELGPLGVVFDDQDFVAVLDQLARQLGRTVHFHHQRLNLLLGKLSHQVPK